MVRLQQIFARESNKLQEQEVVIEGASRLKIQYLIEQPDAKSFVLRRFILGRDGHTSMHAHDYEQGFYVLRGKGEVTDGIMSLPLRKHTVIFVPSNQKHQLRNNGRNELVFLSVEPA
jgi:mannose-6-phosphate isomerase-like protein (cupin superfamily)